MKNLLIYVSFFLFFGVPTIKGQQLDAFFEEANTFFSTYAKHNSIQYKTLALDPSSLDALVQKIGVTNLEQVNSLEEKAFFINSYNLLVIKTVVEHYPIASPNEVVEFWDELEQLVAGKNYTLESLKATILERFQDPLIHLVLVDGAQSSMPIVEKAYWPTDLDKQLESRAIDVLNKNKYVEYNEPIEEVKLSALFKKYAQDFKPSVLGFINQYRVKKIPTETAIKYTYYDWMLNAYYDLDAVVVHKKSKKKQKKLGYSPLAQVITLPKGVTELMSFNSLYTVTYGGGVLGSRNTYFNSYFSAFYGVTGKLDIGATFLLRANRENDYYDTSPFKALTFERSTTMASARSTGAQADWGLTHVGMQIRFAPFKNINLSFEQGILFPIQNLPSENKVDNSLYSVTQMYYIHPFSAQMQLFLALTFWQPINVGQEFNFRPPLLRGFLNYFATPRFSVFVTTMYALEWGVGVKFMLTPKLEIQGMYSYYLPIPGAYDLLSPGATNVMTYNMGLRYRF